MAQGVRNMTQEQLKFLSLVSLSASHLTIDAALALIGVRFFQLEV
jgi:hypothetical protein